jgi:putative ABC transport system ATP-binding protein
MGYLFQRFNLLPGLTAFENVLIGMTFGRGADRKRALELLDRVGLSNRATYRPEQLSIGQRQRVAVARALAHAPLLVLADEPTGSLDAAHAAESLRLMREVCAEEGAALLLVSHDPEVLEQFDRSFDLASINKVLSS